LLPEDFKTWLSIHNGQDGRFQLVAPWELIPIDGIILEAQQMHQVFSDDTENSVETRGAVKSMLWNTAWIPFASDNAGNFYCLDLDPAPKGNYGQVILWASDPPYVEVIAPSYRAWLEQYQSDLEAGKFVWNNLENEWSRQE
jgi:cell wall assembly regulator SMI1